MQRSTNWLPTDISWLLYYSWRYNTTWIDTEQWTWQMTEYNGCHFSVAIAATGQASGTNDDERCIKNITMLMNTTIAQIQKTQFRMAWKFSKKHVKKVILGSLHNSTKVLLNAKPQIFVILRIVLVRYQLKSTKKYSQVSFAHKFKWLHLSAREQANAAQEFVVTGLKFTSLHFWKLHNIIVCFQAA